MTLERDNTAERLARIDKLVADLKPAPRKPPTTRRQILLQLLSLPQAPALGVGRRPSA